MATTRRSEADKHPAAVMLGRLGGSKRSPAQQAASLRNVKKATAARRAKRRKPAR
jgi:hypothetical protein